VFAGQTELGMMDPYSGREQTAAKHFILRHYLQELAFKVLRFTDIVYVDGFSGPWESKAEDFRDSSFMIAIQVLRDAQQKMYQLTGTRRGVRCFLAERNPEAFALLQAATSPHNSPGEAFEIKTHRGEFEEAVDEIDAFIANSFPLIFIDPTGWAGYSLEKIRMLFQRRKCEVLINFMYDFINRFASSDDPAIVASLEPILGGAGWRTRLDPGLPRGLAVEKLFRESLRGAGQFEFVVSTRIAKSTADRPHFFIVYGTKDRNGLKAFRETEYSALRRHAENRAEAKERRREARIGMKDLFADQHAHAEVESVHRLVAEQMSTASTELLRALSTVGPMRFSDVVTHLLQAFMLRETNVKSICLELAGWENSIELGVAAIGSREIPI
jgi:three-Cys-motif partner protein